MRVEPGVDAMDVEPVSRRVLAQDIDEIRLQTTLSATGQCSE